jgi:hypothetical protein
VHHATVTVTVISSCYSALAPSSQSAFAPSR